MAVKTDPRKLAYLVGLLVVLAVVVVYRLKPALVESVVGGTAGPGKVGTYDVPKLGWSAAENEAKADRGGTRDLFTYGPPPTPTPDPRPTPTPPPTLPPRPYVPPPTPVGIEGEGGTRLPPPPAFSLTYLGWLGPDRQPIGVFRDGGEIVVFARGDTVKNRFILREVGPKGVTVGYVGYPANVTKKVALSQ